MKSLETLIRLHKQHLDEARAHLDTLEGERCGLRDRVARLAADFDVECKAAAASYEAAQTFAAYAERCAADRRALEQEIEALDVAIGQAAEVVLAAFQELKKFEISRDHRLERARDDIDRREQAGLDEIGVARFRRRKASQEGQPRRGGLGL